MAILDNFGVTVLTLDGSTSDEPITSSEPRWVGVEEYEAPGSENQQPAFNTCRRYIAVPAIEENVSRSRSSTEFAIDYKIRCGFVFPDQRDTDSEYIVFRTYLDDEKIGGASVHRRRWEKSGTYRQRKYGRRHRVENEHRWIRQRWMFDPGLHGTIKVEVWRERKRIPAAHGLGFVDLTGDDDLVIAQSDLQSIVHEPYAKRPRVRSMVKVDLIPLATFEFEYRSSETLRVLGLIEASVDERIETGVQTTAQQREMEFVVIPDDDELTRTITNTSGSSNAFDTSMEIFSGSVGSSSDQYGLSYDDLLAQNMSANFMNCTDAIGRSFVTGLPLTTPTRSQFDSPENPSCSSGSGPAIPALESGWWTECNGSLKVENDITRFGKTELVDLTMMD